MGELTIFDTSVIYALMDRRDRRHLEVVEWFSAADPHPVTTPLVLAEVDHLAGALAGSAAQSAWRQDLAAGAYEVDWWPGATQVIAPIAERYRDLALGLADASLIALADRLDTATIATLDERHFRAVRPVDRFDSFRLLPTDA